MAAIILHSGYAFAQVTSAQSGNWNVASTWSCNCIPAAQSVTILSNHTVTIPTGVAATASSLVVQNLGVLRNQNAAAPLIASITFQSGSEYNHNVNGGVIPTSTWNSGSTCRITGITSTAPTGGLGQAFHHFTWDCAGQTSVNVQLAGNLTTVNGNLRIANTNGNRQITLGGTSALSNVTLNIGGSLLVENGRVQLGASGTFTVNIGDDFNVTASSSIPDPPNPPIIINNVIVSSSAIVHVNVNDDVLITGGGRFNMLTGTGSQSNLNIKGDFVLSNGTFLRDVSSTDPPSVNVTFNGTTAAPQTYTGGGTYTGKTINYRIASTADVNLQTFGLGQPISTFTNDGIVRLASTDATSAIAGNIRPNTRTFNSGSTIIYTGAAEQFMGVTHPSGTGVTTTIANSSNVTLSADATVGGTLNLTLGDINIASHRLTLNGTINPGTHHLNITSSSSLEIGGTGAFGTVPLAGGIDINSFTISRTSGSVTFEQDLTIQGTLTQTAGDIHLDGTDLVLNGPFARTAGTIISDDPASTFVLQNTGAVPATANFSGTFATFDFNRDAVTMATSTAFTVDDLFLRRGTLNNNSNLTISSGGTIQRFVGSLGSPVDGTGPLFVTYSNQEDIVSGAELGPINNRLEDVLINGSATVFLASDIIVNGDFTIASGGFFAQAQTVTLENNLVVDGLGDFSQSVLIFDGNTTVSGSSIPPFGSLQVTSGSTLTLPSNETISIAGDVDFPASGTVNATNISMTLNGPVLQTISPNGLTINNLTVNKIDDSDVVLTANLSVVGAVLVQSPNTDFASDGFLRLISTSDAGDNGDAWIGPLLDGASFSGAVHVQRFMSNEGNLYRYISSPVVDMSVDKLNDFIPVTGTFTGSSTCSSCGTLASMFHYTNSISNYTAFPAASIAEMMEVGTGYSTFIFQNGIGPNPVTIDFNGLVNQGPIPLPVGYNNTVPTESWNLVGNPYPATIDWDDDTGGWTKGASINAGIAVRDNGASGVFRYWDGTTGDLTDGLIAKGQAFWVRTVDNTDLVLEINELAKASPTPAPFLRTGRDPLDGFTLTLTNNANGLADKAYVKERQDAKLAVDRFDIPKLNNQFFDLSTYAFEGIKTALAINAVHHVDCIEKVGIGLKDMTVGNYTLSVAMSGRFAARSWQLYDKFTNTTVNFNDGTYTFAVTSNAASSAADRFQMILDVERPNLNLDVVSTTPDVCADAAVITIPNAQTNFSYELVVNGLRTGQPVPGESNLAIKLDNALLKGGKNDIQVGVVGGCPLNLVRTVSVDKHEFITATAPSRTECVSGSYDIEASGAGDFNWYAADAGGSPLTRGKSFTTPSISESATYYVAAVNDNGCEGPRVATSISIAFSEAVEIAVMPEEGNVSELISNYAEGNQWSFNGTAIEGATGQTLEVEKPGRYTVNVTGNGCTVTGSVDYAVTGLEREMTAVAWPNPVKRKLTIDIPSSLKVKSLWMQTTSGNVMERREHPTGSVTIDMEQYSPGLYFLMMDTDLGRKVQKIIRD